MINLLQRYEELKRTPSDINEHLPILFEFAQQVDSIVEVGTKDCNATNAFLAAFLNTNKTLYSYDIFKQDIVQEFEKINNNFNFFKQDILKITIPVVDLLFINHSLHTYYQLINELNMHSKNIKKYIAVRATATYAYKDDRCHIKIPGKDPKKTGLVNAINDFLLKDDGLNWFIDKVYKNNNGLTILKRK